MHSGYTGDPVVRGVLVDVPEGGWLGNRWAERRREVEPAQDHGRPAARGRGNPDPRKTRHLVVAYGKSRQLRYTPQDPVLPEGLTVTDYVMLGRTSARSPAQACEICPLWTMCWPGSTSEDWPDAADAVRRRSAARRAGQGPRPANRPAVTVISRLTQPEQVHNWLRRSRQFAIEVTSGPRLRKRRDGAEIALRVFVQPICKGDVGNDHVHRVHPNPRLVKEYDICQLWTMR